MFGTILVAAIILTVGARLADSARLAQEAAILRKLPIEGAHTYYEHLRRRVRRVRIMRAVALVSLALALVAMRRHMAARPGTVTPTTQKAILPT